VRDRHAGPVIGRAHHVVLDCPEPAALAAFYAELLGLHVTYRSDDWVVVSQRPDTSGFAFQLAPDHRAPEWGDPERPQQVHLDVMVDDVAAAEPKVERSVPGGWRRSTDRCGPTLPATRSA